MGKGSKHRHTQFGHSGNHRNQKAQAGNKTGKRQEPLAVSPGPRLRLFRMVFSVSGFAFWERGHSCPRVSRQDLILTRYAD